MKTRKAKINALAKTLQQLRVFHTVELSKARVQELTDEQLDEFLATSPHDRRFRFLIDYYIHGEKLEVNDQPTYFWHHND